MKWISRIKERYSKERIRNLDDIGTHYQRDFIDIEKAKRIGIIVNMNQCTNDDLKLIYAYIDALRKKKKQILVIELNFLKKSIPELSGAFDSIFINPANLNWLDYPTPAIEKKIQKFDLDILIDFDHSDRMTAKYVCSMARAKTRTGMHTEGFEGCYELMIKPKDADVNGYNGEPKLKNMIKGFDYFLNMIGY